jgi:hypothetical protein
MTLATPISTTSLTTKASDRGKDKRLSKFGKKMKEAIQANT